MSILNYSIPSVKGKLTSGMNQLAGETLAELFKPVRSIINSIKSREDQYATVVELFTNPDILISDANLDKGVLTMKDISDSSIEVSEETAQYIGSCIGYMSKVSNSLPLDQQDTVTMTLSDGQSISFKVKDEDHGDFISLVSVRNQLVPLKAKEQCLLYKENGKYKFNSLFPTLDSDPTAPSFFRGDYEEPWEGHTPLPHENHNGFCDFLLLPREDDVTESAWVANFNDRYHTNHAQFSQCVEWLAKQTIGLTMTNEIIASSGLPGYDTFQHSEDKIIWAIMHYGFARAKVSSCVSIASKMLESSCLNEAVKKVGEMAVSGRASIENMMSLCNQYIQDGILTVKHFFNGAIDSFNSGGIKGLCIYIMRYFASPSDLQVGDNGLLEFSDNAKLYPQQYITGLLTQAITAISTIITGIVSMFGIVFAAIATAVNVIVQGIIRVFSADRNATRASVRKGDDYILGMYAPIAAFKWRGAAVSCLLQAVVEYGIAALVYTVPGGLIVCSASGQVDSEGFYSSMWEFHPHVGLSAGFYDWLLTNQAPRLHLRFFQFSDYDSIDADWEYGIIDGRWNFRFYPSTRNEHKTTVLASMGRWTTGNLSRLMIERWNAIDDMVVPDNESSGYLSAANDERVRHNVLINSWVFYLFLLGMGADDYNAVSLENANPWVGHPSIVPSSAFPNLSKNKDVSIAHFYSGWYYKTLENDNVFSRSRSEWSSSYESDYQDIRIMKYLAEIAPYVYHYDLTMQQAVDYTGGGTDGFSWSQIISKLDTIANNALGVDAEALTSNYGLRWFSWNCESYHVADLGASLLSRLMYERWGSDPNPYSVSGDDISTMDWGLYMPQYDSKTFMTNVIVAATITVALTAAVTFLTVKFSKWRRKLATQHTASVEQAWSDLAKNPNDPAAQKAYWRAVKKNNMCSVLTGNQKYSKTNYWGGASDDPSASLGTDSESIFTRNLIEDDRAQMLSNSSISEGVDDLRKIVTTALPLYCI